MVSRLREMDIPLPEIMKTCSYGHMIIAMITAALLACIPLGASAADTVVRLNNDVIVAGGTAVDSAVSVGGNVRVD